MKLKELLAGVEVLKTNADLQMQITSVVYDSRKAAPGCAFVAVAGYATDGNRFIPMAMEKGAAVVVTAKEPEQDILMCWWHLTVWRWHRSAPITTGILPIL